MAEVSHSHSGLLSRGSSVDLPSGSVSLPEYLPSSPQYIQQDRHSSASPSRSQQPSTSPRQSSREKLTNSPSGGSPRLPSPSVATASDSWSPTTPGGIQDCSSATLENARYHVGGFPQSDHENEDRYFVANKNNSLTFSVFDGHDGSRAVGFASNYMMELFGTPSWKNIVEVGKDQQDMIPVVLEKFFKSTEKEFFKSIDKEVQLKKFYAARIPEGMKSYQAQQMYPMEVSELQKLEPKITGGCTAVLAVIANKHLYVANVGDSRAILIRERPDGTLSAHQLSVDHCVQNEEELSRLEQLGLSRENLKRAGRLGMQENTRSIGDYYIKEGYKDVDTLVSAREPPGIETPHVSEPLPIERTFKYLVLMSDGVYKSIEGQFEHEGAIDANKVLTHTIMHESTRNPSHLADAVLAKISKTHHTAYQTAAKKDPRSTVAVNCRKRDDMTCIVYKFPPLPKPRTKVATSSEHPNSAPSSLGKK